MIVHFDLAIEPMITDKTSRIASSNLLENTGCSPISVQLDPEQCIWPLFPLLQGCGSGSDFFVGSGPRKIGKSDFLKKKNTKSQENQP